MRTHLSAEFAGTADGAAADAVLRKCVHCGFCNATCPTYRLLGDELDGPRGRIYLIKQVLEGAAPTRVTQMHLDRCLTCLACETTCPSGVEYGRLVDIGRRLVEARVPRPWRERMLRWLLREGLTARAFTPAAALGRRLRPLLPRTLRDKLPRAPAPCAPRAAPVAPTASAAGDAPRLRRVLLPAGCVQPGLLPNIDRATERVLAAAGIETHRAPRSSCCGALRAHLADADGARANMRRNVDLWWPLLERGEVDAIVVNASACGAAIKDYPHALAGDPEYAAQAARIGAATRDLGELLPDLVPRLRPLMPAPGAAPIAYHAPCTLQHGQRLVGGVEAALRALGFDVATAPVDANLCCGSAGTYSLLQPGIARELRDRKLRSLNQTGAACIASANVGCILHLQSGSAMPVRHWIELVDEALGGFHVSHPPGA